MRHAMLIGLGCVGLFAQAPTKHARELVLTETVDAGVPTIHLRNAYRAPATAWIVGCERSSEGNAGGKRNSLWQWTTQNLSFEGKLLEPGEETTFRTLSPPSLAGPVKGPEKGNSGCHGVHVIAAVFADGTVTGDLRWISATVTRQQGAYEDIAKATELLKKAVADGIDLPDVVQQLVDWQKVGLRAGMVAGPSPGATTVNGSTSQDVADGGPQPEISPPSVRMFSRTAVPAVALWLIQTQGKDLPESIKLLAQWQQRIGPLGRMPDFGERPLGADRGSNAPSSAAQAARSSGPPAAMVGQAAPDITLKDVDGHQFFLKDLRGKTVFVNFWATWCEPCRMEMPQIQALQEKFKDQGLVVVGINYSESAETAKNYFSQEKYTMRNLLDPTSETFNRYGAGGIPKVVLIDKDGIVRYVQQGYSSRQDFAAEITKLGP